MLVISAFDEGVGADMVLTMDIRRIMVIKWGKRVFILNRLDLLCGMLLHENN